MNEFILVAYSPHSKGPHNGQEMTHVHNYTYAPTHHILPPCISPTLRHPPPPHYHHHHHNPTLPPLGGHFMSRHCSEAKETKIKHLNKTLPPLEMDISVGLGS